MEGAGRVEAQPAGRVEAQPAPRPIYPQRIGLATLPTGLSYPRIGSMLPGLGNFMVCFILYAFSLSPAHDGKLQASQTNEKCSQGKFLNVAELSSAADRSSGSAAAIDMGKALKGLAAFEPQASSGLAADSSEKCDLSSNFTGNFMSECQVPGQKAPLDLTLKTSIRVVSSSSVNWIHRSAVCGTMPFFQHCFSTNQNMTGSQGFKGLHSWMYPQSVLPPSLISALSSPTADGELDFLSKRQSAWEESFRDLYYMLRKNICGLFYVSILLKMYYEYCMKLSQLFFSRFLVCTSQFVVMFIGGDGSGSSKYSCNAYMSQSTRGLRSLLKEHVICTHIMYSYSDTLISIQHGCLFFE
ncbi:hypothetical protein AHAS_Ahas16G0032400 [Arachis hypogaea]